MGDGEINEVSAAIGGLQEAVRSLGDQIGNLTSTWMRQDDEAKRSRQALSDKVETMSGELGILKMSVQQMEPLVRAGHASALRASGVRNLFKALWLLFVALVGAMGGAVASWIFRASPH